MRTDIPGWIIPAAAVPTDIPGWVVPGASVLVAIIGALALIIVRRSRGPLEIRDLWAENRNLRNDLDEVRDQVKGLLLSRETQLNVNRIMGDGFDALSNYVERTAEQTKTKPHYTADEERAINRARALRDDDDLWVTLMPQARTT